MSETRRDLFKLSVLSAVGLSGCAAVPGEPPTVAPSPRADNVLNQSDIFARGKLDRDTARYWFLLQWQGGNFIPYYTSRSFDGYDHRPSVADTADAAAWRRVGAGSTITVLADGQEDDGTGKICVNADSTVSVADLQRLLARGSACAISQRSWSEINKS
jgi:hypothetical protein